MRENPRPTRLISIVAFAIVLLLSGSPSWALSSDIVISQVYGGGGNTGSTYRNDFIELFNRGASPVSIAGWSVQYASATGTSWQATALTGTIPAGGYYLVQEAQGSGGTTNLPAPDATGTIAMSGTAGKVALVNTTTLLTGSGCPFGATIVDYVGFGATASCFEGAGPTPAPSNTNAVLRGANGCTETDTNSTDFAAGAPTPRNSASPINLCGGPPVFNLSVNDVALAEGDAGTTTFTFTVSLSAPAPAGGVTFDIATADNTATLADNDYVLNSLTGQTIPAGSSTYAFNVTVNGDTTAEPNETFFVDVTNVVGATVVDGQGTGTINNDDVTVTLIHDVQGPGASSPIVGSSVTVRAVVTAVKTNGFFVQEEEADYDADPATSEGVFVFTGGAPPAAAVVGNLVQVTATVVEFVPAADPQQPPLSELSSPAVVLVSSGNPLPATTPLTTVFPDPAGPFDQLERLEGMRVFVSSLTVGAPTLGNVNEANATATTNGVFYGVVTGNPRAFREAGIRQPDTPPAGSIPPIPRWDSNPESLRVDSDGLGGTALNVGAGAVVTNLVGPLDYTFRAYTILPEAGNPPIVSGPATPTPAAAALPMASELTVASWNLERFFDTVNDPGISEPVLTAAAFDGRLAKASLAIRDFLRFPDILGVVEVENLSTLQALASRISTDALAAAQPDPEYDAYLVEGNDVGGIDVGFLVKTAPVVGATPRVAVTEVVQELDGTLFVNPDASTSTLNDRPPLRLTGIVNFANGTTFPLTVIVNHLRSLTGIDSVAPETNGWTSEGERIRAKRQKQAEDLANLVQARQLADPAERIVLVGDFNAFEFNDGYVDSMNVLGGLPTPDNQTVVPGDGIDLVNPDLDNLFDTAAATERYSFAFDGSAQSLDHILVNDDLIGATAARRVEHPRIGTDFPETARNNTTNVERLSDHDPIVGYFQVAGFGNADLSLTKDDAPDPVDAGQNLVYTITVNNEGPSGALAVAMSDPLPADTTFVSLVAPAGWTCTTPAVGGTGSVSCTIATFPVGSAVFTLTVQVSLGAVTGSLLENTATVTSISPDPQPGSESATSFTTVGVGVPELALLLTDAPDPVAIGQNLVYTVAVTNFLQVATAPVLTFPLPAGVTFASLVAPAGWSCVPPAVGAGGTVTCSAAALDPGTTSFTVTVLVGTGWAAGATINATASILVDSSGRPYVATEGEVTTTLAPVSLTAEKTVTGQLWPGSSVTYTVVLYNAGPGALQDLPGDELTDVLPASLELLSAAADSGTVVATTATNTVTWNGAIPAGGSVTLTLVARIVGGEGTTVSNQATIAWDGDGEGTSNEATGTSDDPATGAAGDPTVFVVGPRPSVIEIPTLDGIGLALLALLLAACGARALRRRAA